MKIEELKEKYRKITARQWFSFSLMVILIYCGAKIIVTVITDHFILWIYMAVYFAEKGNIGMVNAIGSSIKWDGYCFLGFFVAYVIYGFINPKKKIAR